MTLRGVMLLNRIPKVCLTLTLILSSVSMIPNLHQVYGQGLFDPVGKYKLTTSIMGVQEPLEIQLEVSLTDGDFFATAKTDIVPELSRRVPITVKGRELYYETPTPNGSFTITIFVNEDNSVEGTWILGLFLRGNLTGSKLAQ